MPSIPEEPMPEIEGATNDKEEELRPGWILQGGRWIRNAGAGTLGAAVAYVASMMGRENG